METESVESLPRRIRVAEVVESRYGGSDRPASWDLRTEGSDIIKDSDGHVIRLACSGDQSTPTAGWVLLLTEDKGEAGYAWTLYGMQPGE